MSESFKKKSDELIKFFLSLTTPEARYGALIDMGRKLPPFPTHFKIAQNLVSGCQSLTFLVSRFERGHLYFEAASDALISAGLAALLISVYSGETPETILKELPSFIEKLGIYASLSLNRSNGLAQIHLRMKQEAVKFLLTSAR